jgi:hypothetical protein
MCSVWWIDKKEGVLLYRGFVTRRECGGICTLYLTQVTKFTPAKVVDFEMQDGVLKVLVPKEAPWVDHSDVMLVGIEQVSDRCFSRNEWTYYRASDDTMIWVEPVIDG